MLKYANVTRWIVGLAAVVGMAGGGQVRAGIVADNFYSKVDFAVTMLPEFTGLDDPMLVSVEGQGPVQVDREEVPFVQGGRDTTSIEMVTFPPTGTSSLGIVRLSAGAGRGFLDDQLPIADRLPETLGQIRDLAGSSQDGVLDFPTESFFDVFYEVWIDNGDEIVEFGEVLRTENALRMYTNALTSTPPLPGQIFTSQGIVATGDPFLGTFDAAVLSEPLNLRVVNEDGSLGFVGARMDNPELGGDTHEIITPPPIPEPTAHTVWVLMGLAWAANYGCGRRRSLERSVADGRKF